MSYPETKKTIRTFAMASFLNDLGSDIIYPIWPLFVTNILNANMAVLGLIDGLGEAVVAISQAVAGYTSDRIKKRKVFIWTGYLMGALSRVGYAFAGTWPFLVPFRILDRAGKIRAAPRDAIIAEISTQKNRGKHFGLLRAVDNLGAVCGVLVCLLCFRLIGYRNLFLLAAIPSAVGAFLIVLCIRERNISDKKIYRGISLSDFNTPFLLFLASSVCFALSTFSYSFLLLYASTKGFRTTFVPVFYLLFTLLASFTAMPFGKLSDKIGRKAVLYVGVLLWMLVCITAILVPSRPGVLMIFVSYGLHRGAMEPVQKTYVSELAPMNYKAASLGGFQMFIGLCAFPASLVAGLLWDEIGITAPFYFSMGMAVLSAVLLLFVKSENR